MIPELGHSGDDPGAVHGAGAGDTAMIGAWRGDRQWMSLAQPAPGGSSPSCCSPFAA